MNCVRGARSSMWNPPSQAQTIANRLDGCSTCSAGSQCRSPRAEPIHKEFCHTYRKEVRAQCKRLQLLRHGRPAWVCKHSCDGEAKGGLQMTVPRASESHVSGVFGFTRCAPAQLFQNRLYLEQDRACELRDTARPCGTSHPNSAYDILGGFYPTQNVFEMCSLKMRGS